MKLLKKLYIVITVRDFTEIDIIQSLLDELSKRTEIQIVIYETNKIKKTILVNDKILIYNKRPKMYQLKHEFKFEKIYQIGF